MWKGYCTAEGLEAANGGGAGALVERDDNHRGRRETQFPQILAFERERDHFAKVERDQIESRALRDGIQRRAFGDVSRLLAGPDHGLDGALHCPTIAQL